jgi:hypothetical protein
MSPLYTRLPHLEEVNDWRKVRERLASACRRLHQPAIVQHETANLCSSISGKTN